MTKEEKELTITYLTKMQEEYIEGEGYERYPLPEYYALDMAIKALEQQPSDCKIFGHKENCFGGATENECENCDFKIQEINCNATTEEIAQSFKTDIEAVKDYLPKRNSMEFPKTFDEFANDYGFTDDKEIYTNGSHLIPVFRVKQWLDHIEQQPTSDDCVSRAEVLKQMKEWRDCEFVKMTNPYHYLEKRIQSMSPVKTTHSTCKDCKYCEDIGVKGTLYCKRYGINHLDSYYCADFEKRGSENG